MTAQAVPDETPAKLALIKTNAQAAVARAHAVWALIDVALTLDGRVPDDLTEKFTAACDDAKFYVLAYKTTERDGR